MDQYSHTVIFYFDELFDVYFFMMQEDVAGEAETGKIYRSNHCDKHGRTVLVMKPSCQVSSKNHF